jgi:hypothetical protein
MHYHSMLADVTIHLCVVPTGKAINVPIETLIDQVVKSNKVRETLAALQQKSRQQPLHARLRTHARLGLCCNEPVTGSPNGRGYPCNLQNVLQLLPAWARAKLAATEHSAAAKCSTVELCGCQLLCHVVN